MLAAGEADEGDLRRKGVGRRGRGGGNGLGHGRGRALRRVAGAPAKVAEGMPGNCGEVKGAAGIRGIARGQDGVRLS